MKSSRDFRISLGDEARPCPPRQQQEGPGGEIADAKHDVHDVPVSRTWC